MRFFCFLFVVRPSGGGEVLIVSCNHSVLDNNFEKYYVAQYILYTNTLIKQKGPRAPDGGNEP
jgi:hypothetical protein